MPVHCRGRDEIPGVSIVIDGATNIVIFYFWNGPDGVILCQ